LPKPSSLYFTSLPQILLSHKILLIFFLSRPISEQMTADKTRLEEFLAKGIDVPAIPATAFKLNQLSQNPRTTLEDIENVIRLDPSLTGKLMTIVQAAVYGAMSTDSLTEILSRLGMRTVRQTAFTVNVVQALSIGCNREIDWNAFWFHNVLTAQLNEIFYQAFVWETKSDEGYICGLLHDVGKLLIAQNAPGQMAFIHSMSPNGELAYQSETELLGFNHAELSGWLCREWDMPESVGQAVTHHHTPEALLGTDHYLLAAILATANTLANLSASNLSEGYSLDRTDFDSLPAWQTLQEIGPVRALDFALTEQVELAQATVNGCL
jgi:HD-like signal output (HDOD) protein